MNWNELTRAEKLEHLFDYPYEERHDKVRELWGDAAREYNESVMFPPSTPWEEIVAVIKKTGKTQEAYVTLGVNDFDVISIEDFRRKEDEICALLGWRKVVLSSGKPIRLGFDLYDEKTLVCHVCTEQGYRGDGDGFGVEPDWWASALFDFKGNVIGPFRPGYTYRTNDKY